jgi:hypothetical protein
MPDAERSVDRIQLDRFFQIAQLALRAAHFQMTIAAIDGQSCGIVSPILKAFEALQNDRNGLSRTHVANNSTHYDLSLNG